MKENDWIVASINNPDFTPQDFKDVGGMNLENTQLLSYNDYLNNQFIKENNNFKDSTGAFDEQKFKDFYQQKVGDFQQFGQDENDVDNFEYSLFDTSRKPNSRVKDPEFRLSVVSNPDRYSTGVVGRNQIQESGFSRYELAQQSKVFDSETGQYLNYSPNDISLTSDPIGWIGQLFSDPLVMAVYEEDGEHTDPITGEVVQHRKGEYKLDDNGQYYYETLNGRSLIGKEILSATDIITVDGEGLNKYDFFDSDGLDKSVVGTVAKTIASVVPMIIPVWNISTIYNGYLVGREILKSLPMLYGMVSSLWGNEEDSTIINNLAAFGQQLTPGQSEYSKQHILAFENVANIISDVALQYGQQKLVSNTVNKLRGGMKEVEEAQQKAFMMYNIQRNQMANRIEDAKELASYVGENIDDWQNSALGKALIQKIVQPAKEIAEKKARFGRDMSLAYMSVISNTDVYNTILENGGSKRDAAIVALGTTAGMFSVDKFLGLGELFFDEASQEVKVALRNAIKKGALEVKDQIKQQGIASPTTKKGILNLLKLSGDKSRSITSQFAENLKNHTLGFWGKAAGEGLEEMGEELVTDVVKQLYEIAGEFSPNILNESGVTDVGAFDNMLERYGMSFFGGAIGGGLFYGVDVINNGKFKRDTSQDEIIYLIANGKKKELLEELDKREKAGKLGSTKISGLRYEYDKDGKPVFLTAKDKTDTQNRFIYDALKQSITQMEALMISTKTDLSEDDLFHQMVLDEKRFIDLKDFLQDQSYITRYQQDFRDLTKKLINAEQDLQLAYKTKDGEPDGSPLPDPASSTVTKNPSRLERIKELEEKVKDLRAQRDEFLTGKKSMEYVDKMLFSIDSRLNAPFMSMTFTTWLKANKNKTVDELTEAEIKEYKDQYLKYKETEQKDDFNTGYEIYKQFKEKADPILKQLQDKSGELYQGQEAAKKFLESEELGDYYIYRPDEFMEGFETEDEYRERTTKIDGETEEEFQERKNQKVNEVNETLTQNLIDSINNLANGGPVDHATQRLLLIKLGDRKKDKIRRMIDGIVDAFVKEETNDEIKNRYKQLKGINIDFSNVDEIRENIKNQINQQREQVLEISEYRELKQKNTYQGLLNVAKALGYTGASKDINTEIVTRDDLEEVFDFLYDYANDPDPDKLNNLSLIHI